MDFGIYPPEINSGRMYTGPGSGPMLAAAQAWGSLADELYTAASAYQSVVSALTSGSWSGPSSTSMTAAAGSYVEWLSATAAQAEETSAQARAAAAGYEAAFAMTVPPPEIAANRSLLAALVATNFLGLNTPAIAATEALYGEMWAQDAVAMYGYAGSSAAATTLTPFTSPDQTTDPGGTASQAAAVSQASGTAAGNVQSTISTVPQALSAAAAPAQSSSLDTLSNLISVFLSAPTDLVTLFGIIPMDALSGPVDFPIAYLGTISGQNTDDIISGWEGTEPWPGTADVPVQPFPATLQSLPPGGVPAPTMSAAFGEANMVGGLSVPSNWTVAAPEIRSVAMVSPITNPGPAATAPAVEVGSASSFNQMGLGGMAGQAMAGPPATGDTQENRKAITHARLTTRGPGAASDGEAEARPAPRTVVTGVAAAIRDIAKLRDQGRLTDEEYKEQKKRLLEISIRHRPLG
ncbi:PPE family protein, SVP subgroup [Mycobacterium sp.]|jgi:PPE-repeat protein|uniref:PPE family protein, SVP subgroup n=1 Tax=Mycobacterium sp. TaxID=1785 RepID=UPI002CEF4108|nr:PPE domain-containing protein [Mycobacterium sp.]HXB86635.1 PPE domain-containing protein [Mycobacterium sp.]